MTRDALLQVVVFFGAILILARPLGLYMARVFEGRTSGLEWILQPVERLIYKISKIKPADEMIWQAYGFAVLIFSGAGWLSLYMLQRLQGLLFLNPQRLAGISPDSAFNTAISFVSNTNWQGYSGETTMSYLTQMLGLTVQNFVSAATGMAVLIALIRGFQRQSATTVGNFWVDLVRSTLYIMLPLSFILSIALVSQGVVQTFSEYQKVVPLEQKTVSEQFIPLGPVASQIAIKQLGTNGGGYFNANSAHPLENPTPISNFLEMLAILLIPAALCITFGKMVGDLRQGWALLSAMMIILMVMAFLCIRSEQTGNVLLGSLKIDQTASRLQSGGNMEGKEARFGIISSAIWAVATTAASNGSVNSMHDSYTALGGLYPMLLIQLGEVVFGGVGSGLYGMLIFVLITVFVAGLMIGRTPEYLGKKVETYEMKMAIIVVLIVNALVKVGAAIAVSTQQGVAGILNPGAHGFSEILYAFSSAANNNGSAFAGLSANTPFYNITLGVAMFMGRFIVIALVLAIAGSMAKKKKSPMGLGTLPTHTPLFVTFLIGVVLIVGALSFFPSLALGPIAEHLTLRQ